MKYSSTRYALGKKSRHEAPSHSIAEHHYGRFISIAAYIHNHFLCVYLLGKRAGNSDLNCNINTVQFNIV